MSIFSKIFNKEAEAGDIPNPALLEQPLETKSEASSNDDGETASVHELANVADDAIELTADEFEELEPSDEKDAVVVAAAVDIDLDDDAQAAGESDVVLAPDVVPTPTTDAPPAETVADQEATPSVAKTRQSFVSAAQPEIVRLRSLQIALDHGSAADWIEEFRVAVTRLIATAKETEQEELVTALDTFLESLSSESCSNEELIAAYALLIEVEPDSFVVEQDREQREAIIVEALLRTSGANRAQLARLVETKATTVQGIADADPVELAARARLESTLAENIVKNFTQYRTNTACPLASPRPIEDLKELKNRFVELRNVQQAFEQVEFKWSEAALGSKSQLRRNREMAFLAVQIVMARLGELERIATIGRLPFAKRLDKIKSFLREAAERESTKDKETKKNEGPQ